MQTTRILPKLVYVYDQMNELSKHVTAETFKGNKLGITASADTSDYRKLVKSVLRILKWMDMQYRYQQTDVTPVYSFDDIRTYEMFRYNDFHYMLIYKAFAVVDPVNGGFFCFTEGADASLRPLHKEYELFLIAHLLTGTYDTKGAYYRLPFLLALQRTVYLWLMKVTETYEFKGSMGIAVRWAYAQPHKGYYELYSCKVHMEFDMTERFHNPDGTDTIGIDIRLSLPDDWKKNKIEKSKFNGDADFYSQLCTIREDELDGRLKVKFPTLYCNEVLEPEEIK